MILFLKTAKMFLCLNLPGTENKQSGENKWCSIVAFGEASNKAAANKTHAYLQIMLIGPIKTEVSGMATVIFFYLVHSDIFRKTPPAVRV